MLGGSSEARLLAERIADDPRLEAIVSLAGRTSAPLPQSLPTRVGGFGGPEGLAAYLARENIERVLDATHPFAARISANARLACQNAGIPLLRFTRPCWERRPGDRWIEVADHDKAAKALGEKPRRVFLTTGRLELAAFCAAPQHSYLARMIDPPTKDQLPPRCELIFARGPFTLEEELALMQEKQVDVLVTKNSGGALTYAKIEAARTLSIETIMITPPRVDGVDSVDNAADALAFLTQGLEDGARDA
jgi:precorrin-6A/cobalt-precorrin-6A reductase